MKTSFWDRYKRTICNLILVLVIFGVFMIIQYTAPATSMWFSVLRKVCTFALAAVAMNLLNGFTGLFSLGQAGFTQSLPSLTTCVPPYSATTETASSTSSCR